MGGVPNLLGVRKAEDARRGITKEKVPVESVSFVGFEKEEVVLEILRAHPPSVHLELGGGGAAETMRTSLPSTPTRRLRVLSADSE